jgi:hypothetical protein
MEPKCVRKREEREALPYLSQDSSRSVGSRGRQRGPSLPFSGQQQVCGQQGQTERPFPTFLRTAAGLWAAGADREALPYLSQDSSRGRQRGPSLPFSGQQQVCEQQGQTERPFPTFLRTAAGLWAAGAADVAAAPLRTTLAAADTEEQDEEQSSNHYEQHRQPVWRHSHNTGYHYIR